MQEEESEKEGTTGTVRVAGEGGGGTKQSCSMPAREAGDQSAAVDCSTSPSSVARILTPSSVNLLPLS